MTTRVGSASSADRCATRPRRSAAAALGRKLSRQDRLDCPQGHAGVFEARLSRRDSLQAEAGEEKGLCEAPRRALDGEPQLQRQRAAAQEPEDESEGDRETRDQRNAMREECEQKRSGDRGCEQQAFPRLRDATAAEERRQGEPQPNEASQERNVPKPPARCRHRALAQGPVDAGEGPKALADDRDAVRPCHTTEAWEGLRTVDAGKDELHQANLAWSEAARQWV